jgi:hypothetical protein
VVSLTSSLQVLSRILTKVVDTVPTKKANRGGLEDDRDLLEDDDDEEVAMPNGLVENYCWDKLCVLRCVSRRPI